MSMLQHLKNLLHIRNDTDIRSIEDDSVFFGGSNNDGLSLNSNNSDLVLQNSCVNRCLSLIVNAICNLKLVVLKNGKEDQNCLVSNILFNPSDSFCFAEFLEVFVWNYLVFGNSYILLQSKNENFELLNLTSSNVSVLLDKETKSKVEAYSYSIPDNKSLIFFNNGSLPYVGHFKNFNPQNPWYGYSAIDPIKNSSFISQQIDRHNLSIVMNGGRPSGIVCISPNKALSDQQKADYIRRFNEKYSGPDKAGEIMFLNGDCKWQQISGNMKDMDYSDAARRALRSIASGLGVPAELSGDISLTGESSKANMEISYKIFYRSTVMPLANKISQFLTVFFKKSLNEVVHIKLIVPEDDII